MKKKCVVSLIIVFLLSIIGFEVYLYLNLDKNISNEFNTYKKINQDKYLVDITTPYNQNALEYTLNTLEDDKNIYYRTISGLKNKDIENEINNKIKNKVKEIKKNISYEEYAVLGDIVSSFENTISIVFAVRNYSFDLNNDEININLFSDDEVVDTLNIDLNTGKELNLIDIVNNQDALKEEIYKIAEKNINEYTGFSFAYYEEVKADYSKVEDSVLSVIQSFNNNNYKFSYTEEGINFYFTNTFIYSPLVLIKEYNSEEVNECLKNKTCYSLGVYYDEHFYLQVEYEKTYQVYIPFLDIYKNLIIYDKFKNNKNLFITEGELITRKFTNKNNCLSDDYYCSYFQIDNNNVYDISILNYYPLLNTNNLLKRIKIDLEASDKDVNINKVACETIYLNSYIYFKCNNNYYNVKEKIYNKYKKDIFLSSYNNIYYEYDYGILNKDGYDFLDNPKKDFKYYILDINGVEYSPKDIVSSIIYDYIGDDWAPNKKELVNNMEIIFYEDIEIKDKLVLYINDSFVSLRYNDNVTNLTTDEIMYWDVIKDIIKEAV